MPTRPATRKVQRHNVHVLKVVTKTPVRITVVIRTVTREPTRPRSPMEVRHVTIPAVMYNVNAKITLSYHRRVQTVLATQMDTIVSAEPLQVGQVEHATIEKQKLVHVPMVAIKPPVRITVVITVTREPTRPRSPMEVIHVTIPAVMNHAIVPITPVTQILAVRFPVQVQILLPIRLALRNIQEVV